MAREYPRFLFSNPQNTKSKGPFIVHLLEPRLVFKVVSYNKLVCLDTVFNTNEAEKIQSDALIWFQKQVPDVLAFQSMIEEVRQKIFKV